MCFSDKDKSQLPAAKPAQIPLQQQTSSMPPLKGKGASNDYAPPAGPPPGKAGPSSDYAPPPGPPPEKAGLSSDYAPPPGPPPSSEKSKNNPFFNNNDDDIGPPPGPPPAQASGSGSKTHDWETAVPDNSLLPPPPDFFSGFDRSPTNNATEAQAEEGERWCREFPLYGPYQPDAAALAASRTGNINLFAPPSFRGRLDQAGMGIWRGVTQSNAPDSCIASYPPLYSVVADSPRATGRKKVIYYEVHILPESRGEVSLALGFTAPPYPPYRLPGWHRGSLGVHGDDGHKYINDRWGGKTFTKPFKRGDTLGLGMEFSPTPDGGVAVDVFFTRNGKIDGRWNLHEAIDEQRDLPVTGLEGFHDICAAIGSFDKVAFEIIFVPGRWKWKGYQS